MNLYELDPPAQQRVAARRLLAYLRTDVARYHPFLRRFYREHGVDLASIRSLDDFRRLPLIDKGHLRANPLLFVLRPATGGGLPLPDGYDTESLPALTTARYALQALLNVPRDYSTLVRRERLAERARRRGLLEWLPIHTHASSGSSGEPTPVMFTHHDLHRNVREMASLVIQVAQPDPRAPAFRWDERRFSLFPGAPHVAFYAPVLGKVLTGAPSFETFGGAVIPTERQIAMFVRGGFQTLLAIPSYLVYWLRTALQLQQQGEVGPLATLQRIVLGAEPVSEAMRQHIVELAAACGAPPPLKVLQTAGMTEMKWTFIECTERSGVHLNPKYYFWELLDPTTRLPVPPGAPGVLVFTHIGWRGTVLVRYWTGDLIKGGMRWDRCPHCGYTFPRIFPPIGRVDADFAKIKGARVELPALIEAVRDAPGVRYFQVALDNEADVFSRDVVIVSVTAQEGADEAEIERGIASRMKAMTEVTPDRIEFERDEASLVARLFAKSRVKAEYVVERRSSRQ